MSELREVELKLELPAEHADALLAHPAVERFRVGEPHTKRLRSVYFDTTEHALDAAGVSLRVRHVDDLRIQTVKTGERAAGGLFERREHEMEIDSDEPQPVAIDDAALRRGVAAALAGRPLLAVFETDMERVLLDERDGANRWELALDRGHVVAGSTQLEISEVELELVAGDVDRLFEAALALADAFPLVPGGLSKAARGYALARGEHPPSRLTTDLAELAGALEVRADADVHRALARNLGELAAGGATEAQIRASPDLARWILEAGRILAAA
jgi:inorganic triphosphatase YgiF